MTFTVNNVGSVGSKIRSMVSHLLMEKFSWECSKSVLRQQQDQMDHLYQQAIDNLKKTDVWKRNQQVRDWLNTKWLPVSQVNIYDVLHIYTSTTVYTMLYKQMCSI